MKGIAIFGLALTNFFPRIVFADAVTNLESRLDKVVSFYATFTQRVTDSAGNLIQEGQGELWMKRPNLFNWHMIQPDESILVSDGINLWIYNPLIEQVTVTYLKEATNNTPFMLITRKHQTSDWQQYNVKQTGDNFNLVPKKVNGTLKKFTISVSRNGTINQFDSIERDYQRTSYQLRSQKNGLVDMSKFIFTPPKGVTVDDQRNNNVMISEKCE